MHLSPLLLALVLAGPTAPWRHPLSLAGGGIWRARIVVTAANPAAAPAAARVATLRVGDGPGEARLMGAEAGALRICNADGAELLFDIANPAGEPQTRGPLAAGAVLSIPIDCPAGGSTTCAIYFENPRAWEADEWLGGTGSLRNGGLEQGQGDAPDHWVHDPADAGHRAAWCAEGAHTGRRALTTVVAPDAAAAWIATRQGGIRMDAGARYRMSAWVRGKNVVGEAGWYIHVGSAANVMMISPMLIAGSGTFGWKQVTAEFIAPPGADRADLGTVLRGTGTAWFDDVELERLDAPAQPLVLTAGPVERCPLAVLGAGAAWLPGAGAFRAPVRSVNLSGAAQSGLVSVDAAPLFARLQRRARPESARLAIDGRLRPVTRLGDMLLFSDALPARTARTRYLYLSATRDASEAAPAPLPTVWAPNPAMPGGDTRGPGRVSLTDYARLLASPANLVRAASFEQGDPLPEGWSGGAEGQRPAGAEMAVANEGLFGRRCARVRVPAGATPAWIGWRQSVPVRPGRTYLLAAWLRCSELQGGVQLYAHLLNAAGALVKQSGMVGAGPALSGTQGWTLVSGIFTVPDDCRTFQIHLTMNATGTVWHDGVLLAEVDRAELGPAEARPAPIRPGVALWPVNAIVKVFGDDAPPVRPAPARLTAARGEYEPLQLALRADRAMGELRVVIDPPAGPGGARLTAWRVGVVGYVPIDAPTNYYSSRGPDHLRRIPTGPAGSDGWTGLWPDPIVPGDRLRLTPGETRPVWATVRIPADAPAGEYRGAVRVLRGAQVVASAPIAVRVWGFSLPDAPTLKAVYDCRQGGEFWRRASGSQEEQRHAFWQFMAERRLCPDQIQPEPVFTLRDGRATADFAAYDRAAEIYFDRLKFPHSYTPGQFYLFGWGHLPAERFGEKPYEGEYPFAGADRGRLRPAFVRAYQACLRLYWEHMKARGWADRITLYISDEPFDSEPAIRAQMRALCAMIREVDPAIPIYSSTWRHQPEWDGALSVWGIGHYGVVPVEKMRELQRAGAAIWWTTDGQMCTDTPYCAIERLLPHYCFKFGARAYEFWGIDWLTRDPHRFGWHNFIAHDYGPTQEREFVRYPNGDGFLAYPPLVPGGALIPSIRMEQAREGAEDYEYLTLLRAALDRARRTAPPNGPAAIAAGEKALALADALVQSPCEIGRYSTRILPDPDAVLRLKSALGAAIEKLMP